MLISASFAVLEQLLVEFCCFCCLISTCGKSICGLGGVESKLARREHILFNELPEKHNSFEFPWMLISLLLFLAD